MPIFQYKCESCPAVFEHLVGNEETRDVSCVACGSKKFARLISSSFAVRPEDRDCKNCKIDKCNSNNKSSLGKFSKKFVS